MRKNIQFIVVISLAAVTVQPSDKGKWLSKTFRYANLFKQALKRPLGIMCTGAVEESDSRCKQTELRSIGCLVIVSVSLNKSKKL